MCGVGVIVPDEELEDYMREVAKLPERTDIPDERVRDAQREAQRRGPNGSGSVDPEEDEEDVTDDEREEAMKRLGR